MVPPVPRSEAACDAATKSHISDAPAYYYNYAIAQVLKQAGYCTYMTGKWHVGQNFGVTPSNRGFQRSLNAPAGGFYYFNGKGAEVFLDGRHLANDDPLLPRGWLSPAAA